MYAISCWKWKYKFELFESYAMSDVSKHLDVYAVLLYWNFLEWNIVAPQGI